MNPRPPVYESGALPLSYPAENLLPFGKLRATLSEPEKGRIERVAGPGIAPRLKDYEPFVRFTLPRAHA